MEGLAKSASQPVEVAPKEVVHSDPVSVNTEPSWSGVPMAVYRFFNVDFSKVDGKTVDQLKDIYQYASNESQDKSIGGILNLIRDLELKLGQPRLTETAYSKIWNYVTINKQIRSLEKEKEAYLRR